MRRIITVTFVFLFISLGLDLKAQQIISSDLTKTVSPVCGNGICEDMELDGCPACTKSKPPCYSPCDNSKICQKDCPIKGEGGPLCGNHVLNAGEACDDGNMVSGDGCSADCQCELNGFITAHCPNVCGDGIVVYGEACDNGSLNSDTVSGACRTNCKPAHCGDGVVDPGEECDGSAPAGFACDLTCHLKAISPTCGNGILDPGEGCDDGNTVSGDGCGSTCTIEPCNIEELTGDSECPYWTQTIEPPPFGGSTLGDMGCSSCSANSVSVDAFGNVNVVGITQVILFYPHYRFLVQQYNHCGVPSWNHTIDPFSTFPSLPVPNHSYGYGVATDTAGNVYATGQVAVEYPFFGNQIAIIRAYSSTGTELWTQYYPSPLPTTPIEPAEGRDITIDGSGNVYVIGARRTVSGFTDPTSYWVEKYSSTDGAPLIPAFSGLSAFQTTWGNGIITDTAGNIYTLVEKSPSGSILPHEDIQIIKFLPSLTMDGTFGTSGIVDFEGPPLYQVGRGIIIDNSCHQGKVYASVASRESPDDITQFSIIGFEPDGTLSGVPFPIVFSSSTFGWYAPYGYQNNDVAIDSNGNIYVTGPYETTSIFGCTHIGVSKYLSDGTLVWSDIVDDPAIPNDASALINDCGEGNGITVGTDGSVYVVGRMGWHSNLWIRKYTPNGFSDDGPPDFVGP